MKTLSPWLYGTFCVLLGASTACAGTVRCKVVDIDLGLPDLQSTRAHTVESEGSLLLRCTNDSPALKTVELTLYDGAPPPHRFSAQGHAQAVELRFHRNPRRTEELGTTPEHGVSHRKALPPIATDWIRLPIYPQARIPAGFPLGEFSIPVTLRVMVGTVTQ